MSADDLIATIERPYMRCMPLLEPLGLNLFTDAVDDSVRKRQHCVTFVVIFEAVPVAGRFDSAAGGCAAQQITRADGLRTAVTAGIDKTAL
jgi:hypothetical protein